MMDAWSASASASHLLCRIAIVAAWLGGPAPPPCFAADGVALPDYHHTAWTPKDGAPAQVASLAQTTDGWLWLGTTTGLYRFDGIAFERIDAVDGIVRAVFALPRGGLWIGYARGGASLLHDGKFSHYGQAQGLPAFPTHEFALDRKGRMWAAAQNGVYRFDGTRWDPVRLEAGKTPSYVTSIVVDRAGTVWVRAADTIYALPEDATTFRRVAGLRASDNWIYLAVSPDGGVWASGTESGLMRLSVDAPTTPTPTPPAPAAAPDGSGTGPLHFDREGNAWVTLDHGLGMAAPSALPRLSGPVQVFTPAKGLSGEFGYAVIEDREGNIWFGSEGGLDRFRRSTVHNLSFKDAGYPALAIDDDDDLLVGGIRMGRVVGGAFRELAHRPTSMLVCAYRDHSRTVWMGGNGELWRIAGGNPARVPLSASVGKDLVQAIVEDLAGTLWISVRGGDDHVERLTAGAWSRWQPPPALEGAAPNVMTSDAQGRLWFGYASDRIAVVDPAGSTRVLGDTEGLWVGDVLVIHERGQRMWIGGSRGVALLDKSGFHMLRGRGGVAMRGVSGIVETAAGDLWMNGSDGITRIARPDLERFAADPDSEPAFERFDPRDGLDGVAPQLRPLPTLVETPDGRLWFSNSRGLYWIDPARIERNPMEATVFFRSVNADGNTFSAVEGMSFPQHMHALAIGYTALNLSRPERVRFRVRLDGIDADWRDVGAARVASYTDLRPGHYRFRVNAANDAGVWNSTAASLTFSIEPAFYQTGGFRCVVAVMSLAVFYLVYRWQVLRANGRLLDKLEARLAERERIARELHDTLLQGVSGLILRFHSATQGLPEHLPVRRTLESALERADQVLAEGRDRVFELRNTSNVDKGLREALAELGHQLVQEQRCRFGVVVRGTPRELLAAVRDEAFLIAREAVLNAFRHADASRVEVRLSFAPREFRLRVRDDGLGIDASVVEAGRSGHWGLSGMKERAHRIGGELTVDSSRQDGTRVELCLPARLAYADASLAWSVRCWRRLATLRRPAGAA